MFGASRLVSHNIFLLAKPIDRFYILEILSRAVESSVHYDHAVARGRVARASRPT
jgi:hypothetical protein